MPEAVTTRLPRPRDGRLDVLRGLCLLGMVLTHFIEKGLVVPAAMHEVAMHWLRFAAGGFILTSGLCIGVIHYHRALDPNRRHDTYISLLKRAGLVLLVHYFSTFLALLIIPVNGWPMHDVPKMLRDVLYFYSGYDLLLFYVFMLLVSPIVIETVRRFGAVPMLLISLAVFFVKYQSPYLRLWSIECDFPLLRWQLVFIVGILFGSQIKRFDAMSPQVKWRLFAAASAIGLAIASVSVLEREHGLVLSPYLTVQKMPLTITEALRYVALTVALAVLVDRAWPRIAQTRTQRVLSTLGVQSLMLWVAHVPIVANLIQAQWLLALLVGTALLWIVASVGTWLGRQWNESLTRLPKLGYAMPVMGSLAICSLLIRLESPVEMTMQPRFIESVMNDTDESIFFDDLDGTDRTPIPLDDDSITDMV